MDATELERWAIQAAAGDRVAATRLYEALSVGLYGFLVGMTREPAQAEDLLQETFLIALERLPRRKQGNVRAWLYTIARNLAIDRHRSRRRFSDVTGVQTADPNPGPMISAENDELAERVRAEVARLPPSQREVILLRFYGGLSFKEVAGVLGCPLNTALTRAHYGLRKLREALCCEV